VQRLELAELGHIVPIRSFDESCGVLIARPGDIAEGLIAASAPEPLALAQAALRPLALGLVVALVLAALIRESHPSESAV